MVRSFSSTIRRRLFLVVTAGALSVFAGVRPCVADDFKEEVDSALKDLAAKTSLSVDTYENAKRTLETYRDKRAQYLDELLKAVGSDEPDIGSAWDTSCSNGKSAAEELKKLQIDMNVLTELTKSEEQFWYKMREMKLPASRKKIFIIRELTRRKMTEFDELWEKFTRIDKDILERVKESKKEEKGGMAAALKAIDEVKDQGTDKLIELLGGRIATAMSYVKKVRGLRGDQNDKPMTQHARLYEVWTTAHQTAEDVAKGIDYGVVEHEMEYMLAYMNDIPAAKTKEQFQRQFKDLMSRHLDTSKRDWEEFKKRNNGRLIGKVTSDYWSIVADPDLLKPDEDILKSLEQVSRALESITTRIEDKMRGGNEKDEAKSNLEALKKEIESYRADVKKTEELEKSGQAKAKLD